MFNYMSLKGFLLWFHQCALVAIAKEAIVTDTPVAAWFIVAVGILVTNIVRAGTFVDIDAVYPLAGGISVVGVSIFAGTL
jgi:hypothetical protein